MPIRALVTQAAVQISVWRRSVPVIQVAVQISANGRNVPAIQVAVQITVWNDV